MKYKIWYDEEAGVVFVKVMAMLNEDDVNEFMPEVLKTLEGKEHRYIMGDLSENTGGLLTKGARKAFKKYTKTLKPDKTAVIGTNPTTRMITKVILSIMGMSDKTRFFVCEEEALAWLRGEES